MHTWRIPCLACFNSGPLARSTNNPSHPRSFTVLFLPSCGLAWNAPSRAPAHHVPCLHAMCPTTLLTHTLHLASIVCVSALFPFHEHTTRPSFAHASRSSRPLPLGPRRPSSRPTSGLGALLPVSPALQLRIPSCSFALAPVLRAAFGYLFIGEALASERAACASAKTLMTALRWRRGVSVGWTSVQCARQVGSRASKAELIIFRHKELPLAAVRFARVRECGSVERVG